MARLLDDAKSQYASNAAAVVSGVPCTMAGWVYPDNGALLLMAMMIADSSVENHYFSMWMWGGGADQIIASARAGGGEGSAITTAGVNLNAWNHIAAVFSAPNARAAYLHGGNKGTNATNLTPAGLDKTTIGGRATLTPGAYWSGRLAEFGVWNVALTDDEIAQLAAGVSPLMIRPANLVAYWPLVGRDSPEPDAMGTYPMTLFPASTDTGATLVGAGGVAVRAGSGGAGWITPGNITAEDGVTAKHNAINTGYTEWLVGDTLGLAIPAPATILGIVAEWKRGESYAGGDWEDNQVRVVKGGTIQGDNKSATADWPNALGWYSYGGAADLWGVPWTGADINAADFGVALSPNDRSGGNNQAWVDAARVTVTYQDCACHADHPPGVFYPANMIQTPGCCDSLNGALIGHLAQLGVGR